MAFLYCILCLLPACLAYLKYQDNIPNANNVPHPCIPNYRWPGVGHENRNGGGARNVFGQAFSIAGNQWSKTLCQLDSDGDGRTNGEELGDPDCVWSPGQAPTRAVNITNPGVCEPLHDSKCAGKNSFVSCQLESLDTCSVIKNSDVRTIDLRFPKTSIPPTVTTYMCMSFDLPSDEDYHIVADQAIIDNANVLHHMLLYGCEDANSTFISSPIICEMSGTVCGSIIGGWTVGKSGQCYGDKVGFRVGVEGYKRVRLEIHYNNPTKEGNFKDSSGLRLYIRLAITEVQDLFTFMIGQSILELPPGNSRVEELGVCGSDCTHALFKEPVYMISALNHMHYLGRSMKIELYRDGDLISNLTNDELYSYDSPVTHTHNPHVKIFPKDEIITKCVYNTQSTKEWVHYGLATSDEMCYGFLTMYPKSALLKRSQCVSLSTVSACHLAQRAPVNGCNWSRFSYSEDIVDILTKLNNSCKVGEVCRPECRAVVSNISHPCFQPEMIKFIKNTYDHPGLFEIICRFQSCLDTPEQNFTEQCRERLKRKIDAGAINISPTSEAVGILQTSGTVGSLSTSGEVIMTLTLTAFLPLLINDW